MASGIFASCVTSMRFIVTRTWQMFGVAKPDPKKKQIKPDERQLSL
jgi:hypothetical protein